MDRVMRIARRVGALLMIELVVPGGTLIVLGLLATGGAVPGLPGVAARLRALLPVLGPCRECAAGGRPA